MACMRCGTCHKLIMNRADRDWHVNTLGHEEPYNDEDDD